MSPKHYSIVVIAVFSVVATYLIFFKFWRTDKVDVRVDQTITVMDKPNFVPSVLAVGMAPPALEISVLEPNFLGGITLKPDQTLQFLEQVKLENSENPPTFVELYLSDKDNVPVAIFKPLRKDGNLYTYKSFFTAPKKPGEYDLTVKAEYLFLKQKTTISFNNNQKNRINFNRKGFILHVK